jgi:hypothetical protein
MRGAGVSQASGSTYRSSPPRTANGSGKFSCSAAGDSCAPFAKVLESGASSFCPVGSSGGMSSRDVTNLNRIDPLQGQDVRDDHNLIPDLKLLRSFRIGTLFAESFLGRTEIDPERKDTAVEHHGPSRLLMLVKA